LKIIDYTLYIHRYRRHLSFDKVEDLREELSGYFTKSEIASGLVDRLTDFSHKRPRDGIITNSYQDIEVSCYVEEE